MWNKQIKNLPKKARKQHLHEKLDKVLPQRVDIDDADPEHPRVFILRDLDAEHNLYAMRCQMSSYATQLKKLKSVYGDNIRRVLTMYGCTQPYAQPNAVVFWKSIKNTIKDFIECDNLTNWFSLRSNSIKVEQNMTLCQFKKKIVELNAKRLSV